MLIILLEIKNLSISFDNNPVLNDVSLNLKSGEILAIIGASGAGKSLLAHSILAILPKSAKVSGMIKYKGVELTEKKIKELKLRGKKIALIPQSVNFLDPTMKIEGQVENKMLLKDGIKGKYPFQLSGGMSRLALVASAIHNEQELELVIADEPTPGFSLLHSNDMIKKFKELAKNGCAVLIITHDIDFILPIADTIAVLYKGSVLETMQAKEFISGEESLRHPYSKALWRALPQNGLHPFIEGEAWENSNSTCPFFSKCPEKNLECLGKVEMRELRGGKVRCVNAT